MAIKKKKMLDFDTLLRISFSWAGGGDYCFCKKVGNIVQNDYNYNDKCIVIIIIIIIRVLIFK